jgi:hypothetical protein
MFTVIRGYLLLCRDPEGVVVTSGLLVIPGLGNMPLRYKICFNAINLSYTLLNQTTCLYQNTPIYLDQISLSLQARLRINTKIKLVTVLVSITKPCSEIPVENGQDSAEVEIVNPVGIT